MLDEKCKIFCKLCFNTKSSPRVWNGGQICWILCNTGTSCCLFIKLMEMDDDNDGGNDDPVEHDDDHEDDGDGTPKILNIMQRENPRCLFICLELLRPRFLTVSKGGQGHRWHLGQPSQLWRAWIFQNIPKAVMVIFESVTSLLDRGHLCRRVDIVDIFLLYAASPVDVTTIWIVAIIVSQRSSEDLLWVQHNHIKKKAWKCFDMLEMFFKCSFCIFYSLPFVT